MDQLKQLKNIMNWYIEARDYKDHNMTKQEYRELCKEEAKKIITEIIGKTIENIEFDRIREKMIIEYYDGRLRELNIWLYSNSCVFDNYTFKY